MKPAKNSFDSVWISPQFMKWQLMVTSWASGDETMMNRPYRMLEHARGILKDERGEFFRADAITTIKRALDVRLKSINKIYNIKELFGAHRKHLIDALEICGVLRPLMLRQLLEMRNLVEHEDKNPPKVRRCAEFEEYVWYFLKSTDKLVLRTFDIFEFNDPDSSYFEYDLQCMKKINWDFEISGWFRSSHISICERKGWLCCRTKDSETYTAFIMKNPNWKFEGDFKYPPTDIRLSGEFSINMQNELHREFISLFFNAP